MEILYSSSMIAHALTFLRSCMIRKRRQDDRKPLPPQAQFFGVIPFDARLWAHAQFQQLFPGQHMKMTGQQGTAQESNQKITTVTPNILSPQTNQYGIPMYLFDAFATKYLLAQATEAAGGVEKKGVQEDNKYYGGSNFKVSEKNTQGAEDVWSGVLRRQWVFTKIVQGLVCKTPG